MSFIKCVKSYLIVITLLMLTGCSGTAPEKLTVRIAHFPTVTHAQAIVAREMKWFEQAMGDEVEVAYTVFNAGSSEVEAFFSEQVDIGYIGPIPAINGHVKSRGDLVIIAGASSGGARLVCANGSGIQKLTDLDGKRISVPQYGNTQHIALLSLFAQKGMSDISHGGKVDMTVISNVSVPEKMKMGILDAAYLPEPWATLLVDDGIGYYLEDPSLTDFNVSATTAVVMVQKDFLENHPELVEKFLKVHIEATEYLLTTNHEGVSLIEAFLKRETGQILSYETLKNSLSSIKFNVDPIKSSIFEYMNIFYEEGYINEVADENELINLSLLNDRLNAMDLPLIK